MVHEEHMENLRDTIDEMLGRDDTRDAILLLATRHPADQAALVEDLDEEQQERLVEALSPEQLADIVEYLDEEVRARLLENVPARVLIPILDRVDDDITVDIIQDLPREVAEQVVPLLDEPESYTELLTYPEESAGGRMLPDFVSLRREWTVGEAIESLRREPPDPAQPFYVYVTDADGKLTGVVSLRSLVTAPPDTPIAALLMTDVISVLTTDDQEEVAERMRRYSLLALPVVDASGRLRGVITPDRVLDLQAEEATEDIYRMAGLDDEERLFRPVRESVPPRLGWLLINLVTAFLAASVVNLFEGTIEQLAVLAVFMPIVAGMGGNAGIQTITLVVRSMALGELEPRDGMHALRHEATIALIKGVVIGTLVGLIAWVWKDNPLLGVVVGLALLANILNATLIGVLVPITLKRLKLDPALASGVIVTTFSDAVGLMIFLGTATLVISQLT
jgi:magnesium transporter